MPTTVAIDDDLFEKLREAATKRRQTFTSIVNETLRRNAGGRMRVIATIDDPRVGRRILTYLGLGDTAHPKPPASQAA